MARRVPDIAVVTHPNALVFQQRNVYTNDPESSTTATSYYRTPLNMNAQNTTPTYITPGPSQPVNYGPPPPPPPPHESRIDKAYVTSIRGILKFACLIFSFIAFICVVSTPQCNGNHAFLASVTWLVMIMQTIIIIAFLFRLKTKFIGIDFEFLDFFATSHDALYLLIASSVTIHYCRLPGQIAGGVMGIFAFIFLAADAVAIFLARRDEPVSNSNGVR
ncbi:unnamed protein product [Adineta steineri]|uniref:MARVEL domain-containing protein n=2 Tax=Adineta steineri TaxID=433720 RepID=A0A818NQD5_9BILA|nr:unnamed protein product [Adineta steineri]CAF1050600.1 unnamed protein product [Adineta steineri]CAF3610529.1 unnamed protein product [Adineta steineri]CAF3676634.1 unnamed protein product [Adineta steineri]